MTCEVCGEALAIGSWPFCPHGRSHVAMHHDDIPGGMVLENLGPTPVTVYSHSERERIMKERGLELKEKWCPMPGTDKDPAGVMNPLGYVDAYTLACGAEIIARNGRRPEPEWDGQRAGVLRDLEVGIMTEEEAKRYAQ